MMTIETKKVKCRLVGVDGNAFCLLAAWTKAAHNQNWTREEMEAVVDEARSGDYNHLLRTLSNHCEDGGM